jgi:hypothetical protein
MRGLLQAVVVLVGAYLAAAQEPTAGLARTNQAVLFAEENLRLSLPEAGVELNSPRTTVIGEKAAIENSPAAVLFQESTNVADTSSSVKNDEEIITAPLNSLQLRSETVAARAGGMWVDGPLVQLFHTARPGEVPKRLLHLINPFAPMETSSVVLNVPDEHQRAWTELVGWSPGVSAFPDPRTHQPSLSLFSMSTSP